MEKTSRIIFYLTRLVVIAIGIVTVGKSHAAGGLDEDHVGDLVPSVVVEGQSEVLVVRAERALLGQKPKQTGAAGATVRPEGDGIIGGVVHGLHQPVVVVLGSIYFEVLSSGQVRDLVCQGFGGVIATFGSKSTACAGNYGEKRKHLNSIDDD